MRLLHLRQTKKFKIGFLGAVFLAVFIFPPLPSSASHTTETLVFYDGDLIRAEDDYKVYLLSPGKRRWIRNIDVFNSYNFKWEDVRVVPPIVLTVFEFTNLLRQQGDEKVYLISESGFKRHIPSPSVFSSYGFDWNDIAVVPSIEVQSYPESHLIREEGDSKVYLIENNTKRWIETAGVFNSQGLNWNEVQVVNSEDINFFQIGVTITPKTPKVPTPAPEQPAELEEEVQEEKVSAEPISATTTPQSGEATAGQAEPIATVPVPTPTPAADTTAPAAAQILCRPLASGKQTYTATTASIPKITKLTFDPHDIQTGGTQVVTVEINDANGNPITTVSGTAKMDNSSAQFFLSLVAGTDTDGTWEGSWSPQDTLCTIHQLTIIATSDSGTSTVDASFR